MLVHTGFHFLCKSGKVSVVGSVLFKVSKVAE